MYARVLAEGTVGVGETTSGWEAAMRRHAGVMVAVALIAGLVVGGVVQPAVGQGNLIIQAIKLFGIGYVVKTYGVQINDAINSLMANNNAKNRDMTKVVPILSVGVGIASSSPGAYIGAAQVQGPASAVNKVEAVAQIEGSVLGSVRLRGLIPVDSLNPIAGNLHRVYGVGVSALVDFQL